MLPLAPGDHPVTLALQMMKLEFATTLTNPPKRTSPAWEVPQGLGECLGLSVRFSLGWNPGSCVSGFGPGPYPLWASVSSFVK